MKKFLIRIIRFYQKNLSPKKPPCCKFYPSCSAYAAEAIEKRGAFVGFFLSLYRILRCNPFSKGGYDPVPEKGQKRRSANRNEEKSQTPDAVAAYKSRHSSALLPSAKRQESTASDPLGGDANEENRI